MKEVPEEFEPLTINSPFLALAGPFYVKRHDDGFILGIRVEERHCNSRKTVHGGLISTLADLAIGYNVAFNKGGLIPTVTVNLSVDFINTATVDDWIEARAEIHKSGKSLGFANAHIYAGKKLIAKCAGILKRKQ